MRAIEFNSFSSNISSVNEFMFSKHKYPIKTYQYNYLDGSLLYVTIKSNPFYQYMFYPNGELESYWIGDNCYNPDGSLQMKRDFRPKRI